MIMAIFGYISTNSLTILMILIALKEAKETISLAQAKEINIQPPSSPPLSPWGDPYSTKPLPLISS